MKRYYAGESTHGSETSHGFANDWNVYVFESKQARDVFVSERLNLSTIAIKRADVTKYATNMSLTANREIRPRPFTEEFWGIIDNFEEIPGCVGVVSVCDYNDDYMTERFYK